MQLLVSCVALGLGVGTVLVAALGSDGYSSLVNGVSRASGAPYAYVNWTIGFAAVLLARLRGVRPGLGTVTQPVVVGLTVNGVLDALPTPGSLVARALLLTVGSFVLAAGVAGYLEAGLGAGPFEAATLALDPVPFRLAYGVSRLAAPAGLGTRLRERRGRAHRGSRRRSGGGPAAAVVRRSAVPGLPAECGCSPAA